MSKGKSKFGKAMWKFVWGEEVELGDCIFYTVFTFAMIGIIWLFTFEKWFGIDVKFSLIAWLIVAYLIWKQYYKMRVRRAQALKKRDDSAGNTSHADIRS
jgi:hypothetical protein